jgi:hypothetical protein
MPRSGSNEEYVMTSLDQPLDEVRADELRASVASWRHLVERRRNDGDA